MMVPYQTIINGHQAVLPAWDGVAVCDGGCSCSTSTSLSRPITYGHLPGSGEVNYYEPSVISSSKTPRTPTFHKGRWVEPVIVSAVVSMTPYYNTTVEVNNTLIQVPFCGHGIWRIHQRRRYKLITPPSTCSNLFCGGNALVQDMARWTEQYDYNSFYNRASGVYVKSLVEEGSVQDAIQETQASSALASYKTYDALTDLLQFKELAQDMKSGADSFRSNLIRFLSEHPTSDLRRAQRITPRQLLRSSERILRKIGSAWLAYRYLLMPLIYSYMDIKKTLERWQITRDKSTRRIETSRYTLPNLPDIYILKEEEGNIRVTSTVACKYENGAMARAAATSVNIASTAWELIPFSFVADWFINVGDYITNMFSADLANSSGACTAVKVSKMATYTAVWKRGDTSYPAEVNTTSLLDSCWPSGLPSRTSCTNRDFTGVLRVVRTNSYSRSLFNRRGAVKLQFSPYVSWKRIVDAGALSQSTIKQLMSTLRVKR